MAETAIGIHSLVLYKHSPAVVLESGDKYLIQLEDGSRLRVREKDVVLLHPGPVNSLEGLTTQSGEVELAWQILVEDSSYESGKHTLEELAELIYGEFTPATAWGAWSHLDDGLYFQGSVEEIRARLPDEVVAERLARKTRQEEAEALQEFLERVKSGQYIPEKDDRFLREVEDLALARTKDSRILGELGRSQRPENAHAALLELGYWDSHVNPYPTRFGTATTPPAVPLNGFLETERADLTDLAAYAIDDPGNQDPDDAISLVSLEVVDGNLAGGQIWVHVADAAALVPPGSAADLEARARGASLYLPEGMVPMLPREAVDLLGLGLKDVSPALSFRLALNGSGEIEDLEIVPSWVRVECLTYQQVEGRLDQEPFRSIYQLASLYENRRRDNGAVFIDLPEVKIRIEEGRVEITPLPGFKSRDLVREAMLMAGEGVASFAAANRLPFPYVLQDERDGGSTMVETISPGEAGDLAHHYALRRGLARSLVRSHPGRHTGVGLPAYTRATSPLRRYTDLVVHQQLRAYLDAGVLLSEGEVLERVAVSESAASSLTQVEALSRKHWTLVYLLDQPDWRGEGVLVEKHGMRGKVIIPELAFEAWVHLEGDMPLNSVLALQLNGINLPELEGYF